MNAPLPMDMHSSEKQVPFNLDLVIHRGLGRMLLVCFLGFAMLPMGLLGFFGYRMACHGLDQVTLYHHHVAAELKSHQLKVAVDDTSADTDRHNSRPTTADFFSRPATSDTAIETGRFAFAHFVDRLRAIIIAIVILSGVAALVASVAVAQLIVKPIRDLSRSILNVASDQFDRHLHVTANNEIGELAAAFDDMVDHLQAVKAKNDSRSRLMSSLADLHRTIDGERGIEALCLNILEFLSDYLDLCQADFYLADDDGELTCAARFPGHPDQHEKFQHALYPSNEPMDPAALGRPFGAIWGRQAIGGIVTPVPTDNRATLIAVPLVVQKTVKGVLKLEKKERFSDVDLHFMEKAADSVAVSVNAALAQQQEETLLKKTQAQARKLKVRETALAASNRELRMQRRAFLASGQKLQLKQLELEAANAQMTKNAADLEAHMDVLKTQKRDMQRQNTELEQTHRELEEKARQLELSSRYKTEFMANMSHELRTPLNSILLLSHLLLENKEQTLTVKQIEFAQTIHSAGEDLLNLINDILDLAKVESGTMEVALAPVQVSSIATTMRVSFAPLAEQCGVGLITHVAPATPPWLMMDRKRVEQILKNFLTNAFKFTTKGTVRLDIAVSQESIVGPDAGGNSDGCLAISVSDTGIGIPAAKHEMVFEAFQQVDGSTRRKYSGTGLGLSISRELARLLGGKIVLESECGQGSRFTLHLPLLVMPDEAVATMPSTPSIEMGRPVFSADNAHGHRRTAPPSAAEHIEGTSSINPPEEGLQDRLQAMDDRQFMLKGRNVLLVDDDMRTVFAVSHVLEEMGIKVVAGKTGKESLDKLDGFPDIDLAIIDVMVFDVDGYRAIREIRDHQRYRTLPIIVLTAKALPGDRAKCIAAGADDYLAKPVKPDKLTAMLKLWLNRN